MAAMKGPQVGIREIRRAYGLTLTALAGRIRQHGVEVDPDHLSNVELGWKKASPALMTAWCEAFNIHPLDVHQPEPIKRPRRVAS